jgi:hypothetical protein
MDVRMAVRNEDILSAQSREEIKSLLKTSDILLESNNAYLSSQIVAKLLFHTNWIHAAIYAGDEKVIDSGRNPAVAVKCRFWRCKRKSCLQTRFTLIRDRVKQKTLALRILSIWRC